PLSRIQERGRKQLEINREIESIMYDELKLQRPVRSANSLFTAEQEEKIAEAKKQFPSIGIDPTNPESAVASKNNRLARLQFLSRDLSEEQLRYYKLDREGEAHRVEMLVGGMQPTKDEFLRIADAIEGKDSGLINGHFSPELVEALRRALPPERLALLEDLQQPQYAAIREFAFRFQSRPATVGLLASLP